MKYIKEKTQQLVIRYKKEEYDTRIKPAIDASGLPVSTYIKMAINEKIARDLGTDAMQTAYAQCELHRQ